jgi:diguanylate cyclase (GGDEF)-like protein
MKNEQVEQATILVVDDTPTDLQVLLEHLREAGLRLLVARNGEAALRQAMISNPDLILLDVIMPPGIDGFETCRRLKQQTALKEISVIFLTALSDSVDKARGIEVGGVDYITKPVDGAELLTRVNTHLTLHHYRKALEQTNRQLQQANEALVQSRKKLEVAARTDPLTELPNRRDMLDKLGHEKIRFERHKKPFVVALCDIDSFKQINDRFGHDCGDAVLVSVARLMRSMIRKQDLVARWGGREFLFVLPETDAQGGLTVCEKMRTTIEQHAIQYNEHELFITVTFGVSVFDAYEKSVEQPVREADLALYHGKQRGRNQVALFGKKTE